MTITFFANFMNHHQLPLSLELIKLLGDGNYHLWHLNKYMPNVARWAMRI